MSDGFPSHSCAEAILSHGEVDEVEDRFPVASQVFCRGRRTVEVQTHLIQESRVLWTMMRVGQSTVVPGRDGGRSG